MCSDNLSTDCIHEAKVSITASCSTKVIDEIIILSFFYQKNFSVCSLDDKNGFSHFVSKF